jgi:hypothetical protein
VTRATLLAPSASEGPGAHADWLELRALEAADRNSSIQDLVQVIRRTGTIEAIEPDDDPEDPQDRGAEKTQVVAEDAFAEIEDRHASCGGNRGTYPFRPRPQYIELRGEPKKSLYLFLLLLSRFGKDSGPRGTDGAKLFELLSVQVAAAYFGGGAAGVESYHFGAPRRSTPRRFVDALNDMCRQMGEGQGCRVDRHNLSDQKDAKLDLTVWRPFRDKRPGMLMGFGQCATGNDWSDKLTHLQPEAFCGMWMVDTPAVAPVRLFFVPFRIEQRRWLDVTRRGGIVFDRCRIATYGRGIGRDLIRQCAEWTGHVLKGQLGT